MSSNTLHQFHVESARFLCRTRNILLEMCTDTGNRFGKQSKEHRRATRALKEIDELRSVLDSAYHAVISEEQFKQWGHVYYKQWPVATLSEVRK